MEVVEAILALLGLGGISLTLVWLLFAVFNLLWAILSAVLATRRGRNAWNWFFLTCFYGIFGLLFLACSKTINQGEYRESDTLAKVLWGIFLIPATIVVTLIIIASVERHRENEQMQETLENSQMEQITNQKNIEFIERNEKVSREEAERILKEAGLSY